MVTRIHSSANNMLNPLHYNYRKVEKGAAELIAKNACETGSFEEMRDLFARIMRRCVRDPKKVAFHMTINPGRDDSITEEQIPDYARDMMEGLGYGEQPWVLFRHKDIDRVHYHVVSIAVNNAGVKIDSYHNFYRCQNLMETLKDKYGFTIGNPSKAKRSENGIPFFERGQEDVVDTINDCVNHALAYGFTTARQFADILRCHGVGVKQGVYLLSFQGLDEAGEACTPLIGEDLLDEDVTDRLEERMKKFEKSGIGAARGKLAKIVGDELNGAEDYEAFRTALAAKGIDVVLSGDRNGRATGSNIIDHVTKWAVKGTDLTRSIGRAVVALANAEKEDGQRRLSGPSMDVAGSSSRALLLVAAGACERMKTPKKKGTEKKKTDSIIELKAADVSRRR